MLRRDSPFVTLLLGVVVRELDERQACDADAQKSERVSRLTSFMMVSAVTPLNETGGTGSFVSFNV